MDYQVGPRMYNIYDAVVQGVTLAITAPTDKRLVAAVEWLASEAIANGALTPEDIERAKLEAQTIVFGRE